MLPHGRECVIWRHEFFLGENETDKKLVAAAGKEFGEVIAQRINEVRASHGDKIALMTNEIVRELLAHSVILSALAFSKHQTHIDQALRSRFFNFMDLIAKAHAADKSAAYAALQKAAELAEQLREYLDVLATDVTIDETFKGTE